jgi:hypothetical protein
VVARAVEFGISQSSDDVRRTTALTP